MLKKFLFIVVMTFLSIISSSCELPGFSQPFTLDMKVPDGSVEYRAGWRAGCRTGIFAVKSAPQGWVYGADYGTGAYQHHPDFYSGWSNAWFTCRIHTDSFVNRPNKQSGPLN